MEEKTQSSLTFQESLKAPSGAFFMLIFIVFSSKYLIRLNVGLLDSRLIHL